MKTFHHIVFQVILISCTALFPAGVYAGVSTGTSNYVNDRYGSAGTVYSEATGIFTEAVELQGPSARKLLRTPETTRTLPKSRQDAESGRVFSNLIIRPVPLTVIGDILFRDFFYIRCLIYPFHFFL